MKDTKYMRDHICTLRWESSEVYCKKHDKESN